VVPFYVYLLITLGFGSASAGTATLGAVMARWSYLSAIIDCIGKCAVGTGLYLIAFQRMQQSNAMPPLSPERWPSRSPSLLGRSRHRCREEA
jgi:hypothetical protein